MKKVIILLLTISSLTLSAQGIDFFKGTFEEAKALAEKENKLIFMDAYAAWCGPCKRMAKNVFPTKEAGDYFNANFINLKMNMEKGEGRTLAKKYRVGSYPTLLFLDFNGDVIYETKGARRDAAGLIALGKKALLPNKNALKSLQSKWDKGNRDPKFLKEFVNVKMLLGKDNSEPFEAYLAALTAEEKKEKDNILFIYKQTKTVSSPGLPSIYSNKALLKENYGEKAFDKKINKIAIESIEIATKTKNNKTVSEVKAMLYKLKTNNYKQQANYVESKYFGQTKQWNAYDKSISKYLKKYKKNDAIALKNVAWNYYINIKDTKKLQKAAQWMTQAIALNNSYENNLTQAYLYYKLANYSAAQDAIEYALILAKDSTKKTKNAQILKSKIEKALQK